MVISPTGTPKLAHSLLVMLSFPAAIIFGILPGISIPPLIISTSTQPEWLLGPLLD